MSALEPEFRRSAAEKVLLHVLRQMIVTRNLPYQPFLGMPSHEFELMVRFCAPGLAHELVARARALTTREPLIQEEFGDVLALLLEHRSDNSPITRWLAYAISVATLGSQHLWQDLGVPQRRVLNELMAHYFPGLHRLNRFNMRWKKFIYRQLCERAGLLICKSPNCRTCSEYDDCFPLSQAESLAEHQSNESAGSG